MENILLYGLIGLGIIVIILSVLIFILSKRIKSLSSGNKTSSLESIIIENNKLAKKNTKKQIDNAKKIMHLKTGLTRTIQNISIVRFDAIGDSGGMQSFAIGLTDMHKTGIVISSMYTRGGMKVFAKEIIKGESKHKLTEEEKQVIS